jgi:hypothetical protein
MDAGSASRLASAGSELVFYRANLGPSFEDAQGKQKLGLPRMDLEHSEPVVEPMIRAAESPQSTMCEMYGRAGGLRINPSGRHECRAMTTLTASGQP